MNVFEVGQRRVEMSFESTGRVHYTSGDNLALKRINCAIDINLPELHSVMNFSTESFAENGASESFWDSSIWNPSDFCDGSI